MKFEVWGAQCRNCRCPTHREAHSTSKSTQQGGGECTLQTCNQMPTTGTGLTVAIHYPIHGLVFNLKALMDPRE